MCMFIGTKSITAHAPVLLLAVFTNRCCCFKNRPLILISHHMKYIRQLSDYSCSSKCLCTKIMNESYLSMISRALELSSWTWYGTHFTKEFRLKSYKTYWNFYVIVLYNYELFINNLTIFQTFIFVFCTCM